MAFNLSTLAVKVTANIREFLGGMSKVENRLSDLKKVTGKQSLIGDLSEIVVGGGVIAGLALAAKTVEQVSAGARQVTEEFRDGAIAAEDIAPRIIKSIPILGNVQKAAENVWFAFSGEGVSEKALENIARIDKAIQDAAKGAASLADIGTLQREAVSSGDAGRAENLRRLGDQVQRRQAAEAAMKEMERQMKAAQELARIEEQINRDITRQVEEALQPVRERARMQQSIIDGLAREAETFGMTSEQIALYDLRMSGASERTLEYAAAQARLIEQLRQQEEETKKLADAEKRRIKIGEEVRERQAELFADRNETLAQSLNVKPQATPNASRFGFGFNMNGILKQQLDRLTDIYKAIREQERRRDVAVFS